MRRFRAGLVVFAALSAGLCLPAPAGTGGKLTFGGYFKNFSTVLLPPALRLGDVRLDQPDLGAVSNRLRLELSLLPSSAVSFQIAYDLSPIIQDRRLWSGNLYYPGLESLEYRFADLRPRLYPEPGQVPASFGVMQNFDRCLLSVKLPAADILVGRQAIAWGSARVINPTDVLVPFAFNELDKEERRGVDALRVRIPLGTVEELDLGAVSGRSFDALKDAFYARGRIHRLNADISGLAMAFRGHLLIGLDLARSIGGAGSWLEAAYVVPDAFREEKRPGEEGYFRASAGLDYNFSAGLYGFAEYHFNSAGAAAAEDYLSFLDKAAYRDGAVYLLGRHYLSGGLTYQLSPLLPVTGLVIVNLTDPSFVIAPSLEYNIAENIYLAGGAYLGIGRAPEIGPGPPPDLLRPSILHSEFGAYPDLVYGSFRVYF